VIPDRAIKKLSKTIRGKFMDNKTAQHSNKKIASRAKNKDKADSAEDTSSEIGFSLESLKKNWHWIALALILFWGFSLRMYHLDYPAIGYHNWKEAHYLTEARNFARNGDWLTPRSSFPTFTDNMADGSHGDTLPLSSWAAGIGFLIFGEELWVARLTSILFVMASVMLMYLIIKRLFNREDLALVSALLMSVNPLLVFFGRQVQLNNPALFFGMLSVYLFIRWADEGHSSTKLLSISSLCMVISFLTQYSFAILAIPLLTLLPLKRIKEERLNYFIKGWKQYAMAALPALLIPLWLMNNARIASANAALGATTQSTAIIGDVYYDFGALFSSKFWDVIMPFIADNYSIIGAAFSALGLVLLILMFKRSKGLFFAGAYSAGAFFWLIVMASKLSGHSYHQYPLAPLMILLAAFAFVTIASTADRIVKYSKWPILFGLFLLLIYPPILNTITYPGGGKADIGGIFDAKDRQFDQQFIGLDAAGDYLRAHSAPEERVFFSGHQSYGFLWHADRMGTAGHYNESMTRLGEEEYDFRWVLLYQWGLQTISDPEKWDYLSKNYALKNAAFQKSPDGKFSPVYFLLEKGGSFNISDLNTLLQSKQPQIKEYELTRGKVELAVFNV